MAFRYIYLSLFLYNHSHSVKNYVELYFKPLFDKKPMPIVLEYPSKEDSQEFSEWDFMPLARELRDKDLNK